MNLQVHYNLGGIVKRIVSAEKEKKHHMMWYIDKQSKVIDKHQWKQIMACFQQKSEWTKQT